MVVCVPARSINTSFLSSPSLSLPLPPSPSHKVGGKLIRQTLKSLTSTYPSECRSLDAQRWNGGKPWEHWGEGTTWADLHVQWHCPSSQELDFADQLLTTFMAPSLTALWRAVDTAVDTGETGSSSRDGDGDGGGEDCEPQWRVVFPKVDGEGVEGDGTQVGGASEAKSEAKSGGKSGKGGTWMLNDCSGESPFRRHLRNLRQCVRGAGMTG